MDKKAKVLYFLVWLVAIAGMLGSLYFSEVRHLVPCLLCWYQRICMYPLVLIGGVGIVKQDRNLPLYVLPLSIIGLGIAIFHYLLQLGVIPDNLAPCAQGVSCASVYVEYFGFVTIPFLSLLSFAAITVGMLWAYRLNKKNS